MNPKVHAAEQSFYISNLHCAACKKIIEDQIRPLPGILFCGFLKGTLCIVMHKERSSSAEKLNEQFRNDFTGFLSPLGKSFKPRRHMGLAAGGALLIAFLFYRSIQTDFEPGFCLILGLLAGFFLRRFNGAF